MNGSATWMGKRLVDMLRATPETKPSGLRHELKKYGLNPTKMQLYRSKRKAMIDIKGDHAKSFGKLPAYGMLVMQKNPGSLVKLHFTSGGQNHFQSFKRIFLGLSSLAKGFNMGCRPFLGLDGCHLKGPYGGVLLSTVALDANSEIYPVAVAVVESETKESWSFFLTWLVEFLGTEGRPWTMMSDRQKGFNEAINEILPNVVHRYCARHIYQNFRALHSGVVLRDCCWGAAKSFDVQHFSLHMARLREVKPEAHAWLEEIPISMWAGHAFDRDCKVDHCTNNITESFNNWIGDLRDQPILNLLDALRCKVMCLIQKRLAKMQKCNSLVTPKIVTKLNMVVEASRKCNLLFAGQDYYQIMDIDHVEYTCNLRLKTCECKVWEISGIPYKHAELGIAKREARLKNTVTLTSQ